MSDKSSFKFYPFQKILDEIIEFQQDEMIVKKVTAGGITHADHTNQSGKKQNENTKHDL